ncbi:MAG: nucleotide sugar dehydrogenase, partial [Sphingopyxis sp.]
MTTDYSGTTAAVLGAKLADRTASIGVIGMGYVGLPLALAAWRAGFSVTGFDVDQSKITALSSGKSYLGRLDDAVVVEMGASGRFSATDDFSALAACDVVVICVPTPLNKYREPDLSYVLNTTRVIAQHLRAGQLITLESTTYPGTTRGEMAPILEAGGLKSGVDFFLAFSPEREDPGNPDYHTATIPKVVGGDGPDASKLAETFYGSVVVNVVPVTSCEVAEAVKLTENIFRSVNIALVNELKLIYDRMGINVWDVIDAAKTKPFGYMPFYPGPGLGGHCIPIDPFYLTWKAREYGVATRF